ncbi:hypothetical protein GGS23DRAFT_571765 [Durotheca rogersii]|uniref:uncharacterized protein n=1 Tax=Durotheca rogersii TaxID=419775 RepID=UPI00221FFF07|nr:uncharacterized protein GGS23DRAFT_571765 [Durotheca rogersii]KAI5862312.1 hypothetical protein GGS23DRAFT_571765 [Durotheca rogersii]
MDPSTTGQIGQTISKPTAADDAANTPPALDATRATIADLSLEEEPASSLRRRKLTGSERDGNSDTVTNPDPESPKRQALTLRTREESERSGSRRRTRAEMDTPKIVASKGSRISRVLDSEAREDHVSELEPRTEPTNAPKQLHEEASHKSGESHGLDPKPKNKHVVFGDDDDVDDFIAKANREVGMAEVSGRNEQESGSDDDDTPEAVSTRDSAQKVHRDVQEAYEVTERTTASLKRKRRERDSLYKKQAEQRKRTRVTVEVHQAKPGSAPPGEADQEGRRGEIAEFEKGVTGGRRRVEKFNLPTVLPAEFLTDSSSDDEALERVAKKPKKITFEDAAEALGSGESSKKLRDEVVGSTRYRVLAQEGDSNLAPPSRRGAKRPKENLLKRTRVGVTQNKGFLVKR